MPSFSRKSIHFFRRKRLRFLRQIPLRNPFFRVENLSVLRTAVSGQRLAFRQRFIVVPRAVRQIIAVAVNARNALLRRETQLVKSRGRAAQRIERERNPYGA